MNYSVYILYSESLNVFYKGQTNDLSDRINRHNKGQEKATQYGVPWKLVWSATRSTRSSAIILERKLKNLSRKRLIDFILKYHEGVEGPDDPDRIVGMSGC